eukprot:scaffold96247_cov60-Phaeocystis_antarctica.AAC.2
MRSGHCKGRGAQKKRAGFCDFTVAAVSGAHIGSMSGETSKYTGYSDQYFSTGGLILVSDYVRMEVTLVDASWDVVAGDQRGVDLKPQQFGKIRLYA